MMTSTQIRQSFLDFFKSKQHTIVPSSSLMPDSPNLLFTNAGMNQFVPIFLGQVKCPYNPGRAADTQKCIRAGGKHNDLDDVGLDTYHHTFFEMLGNWSFGDYFKKEAIAWAWELVINVWKFPPQRLYATVYNPDQTKNDPSEFDQEAWNFWAEKFRAVGLDPAVHIVNGNKKDNFWMMGDTGPCGPCSELHVDLTPEGDTRGSLVNKGDARCIEIWNLVFIQFNANPDGTFSPLPAQHVDTGMGFERVTSIIQGTRGFSDFKNAKISNYETDIFRPIFDELEKMSGKRYHSTLPGSAPAASLATDLSPEAPLKTVGEAPETIIEVGACETNPASAQKATVGAENRAFGLENPAPHAAGGVPHATGGTVERSGGTPQSTGGALNPTGGTLGSAGGTQNVTGGVPRTTGGTVNPMGGAPQAAEDVVATDIAFRVIADHIRTLSFAIADGIQPGNTDRNYVLRRILRRAVRYGRTLGFHEPFFYKLVDVLAQTMGDVFPEIRAKQKHVKDVLKTEEESFNKTLDRGIQIFEDGAIYRALIKAAEAEGLEYQVVSNEGVFSKDGEGRTKAVPIWVGEFFRGPDTLLQSPISEVLAGAWKTLLKGTPQISGEDAFQLYDTYGFPLDLTELMARERGLSVDTAGFEKLMDEQRARARAAQKKEVIELADAPPPFGSTAFVGFDTLVAEVRSYALSKNQLAVDVTPFYAEMGGQVGDTGILETLSGRQIPITNTVKGSHGLPVHIVANPSALDGPDDLPRRLIVDRDRRRAIERHHTVTHLLHWALHEVVSKEASQKGSFVGPDKLTFDFNAQPLTPQQVADIEKLVNERVLENAGVSWTEVPYADVKSRKDVMQFFGDKYGDTVRVVQVGGRAGELNGYSMELCGGTHTRATGEIGLFRIVGENAIAAGVRRIEAVAGLNAYDVANQQLQLIKSIAGKINSPVHELEKKIEALLAHQKELEKSLRTANQRESAGKAKDLVAKAKTINGIPALIENVGAADGDTVQSIVDAIKANFKGVIILGAANNGAVTLIASVSPEFTAKVQAGKIIQTIAPIVGGKGGGKPDNARGGGKDASKLDEALAKAASLLG